MNFDYLAAYVSIVLSNNAEPRIVKAARRPKDRDVIR